MVDNNPKKLAAMQISRLAFITALVCILAGVIVELRVLGLVGIFLAAISWMTSGLLLLVKQPALAQYWLRGINTVWIPAGPWGQLSSRKRFAVYFYSILLFVVMVLAVTAYMYRLFGK